MTRFLRELRRAPARIVVTVLALALALGAIGVMGVPEVSRSSLRDEASADAIANIAIDTTDTGGSEVVELVESVAGVDAAEPRVAARVDTGDEILLVLGGELDRQEIDVVHVSAGRLPTGRDEVLVPDGMADIGATIDVAGSDGTRATLRVVGTGGTSYWAGEELAYASMETARALAGIGGSNRLVVHAAGDADDLRRTADAVRDALAAERVAVTALPVTVPGGAHPIEADIEQISLLVGLLGIVAGLVALVLLGSTTTTLITERAHEVAVMRALGGRKRAIRRRLRRLALTIAAAAVVVGVPLGVLVSNLIARMVLEEFVGLTPGFALAVPVMVGSALFALVGARLVAASAARRVTNRELAAALRDRDANPFGRRISERLAARAPLGGLLERWGLRNGLHQRARSLTMLAQVTAAVAALLVITSMATTITAFNDAEHAHWSYASATYVPGPGLDMSGSLVDGDPRAEMAIEVEGEYEDWLVDVVGLAGGSEFIDPVLDEGAWYGVADPASDAADGTADDSGDARRQVVLSTGFAERVGVGVGDSIELRLANGDVGYEVTGLHPARGRYAFTEVDRLAADLGSPGRANVLLSLDDEPSVTPAGPISIERFDDVTGDEAGRRAVLLIFAAIGGVIVSVAGLAVASGLAVNVYERRHELAALQALGGRRRHIMRVIVAELTPIVVVGIAVGVGLGYLGALGLVNAFEAADAVEIGLVFSSSVVPVAAVAAVVGALGLGSLMARRVTRGPAAVTLRGAG